MTPTLQKHYKEAVVPELQEQLGLTNVNQVLSLIHISEPTRPERIAYAGVSV